ncbi:unnamed protein product [Nezara viridula]|uniref:Uncharacterized protein n=1 Tax=Nezara viridula TaxID=85310 RepID=A0A9P0HPA6_NEZVI|nr:unnamed protein product [Nezara viridula]
MLTPAPELGAVESPEGVEHVTGRTKQTKFWKLQEARQKGSKGRGHSFIENALSIKYHPVACVTAPTRLNSFRGQQNHDGETESLGKTVVHLTPFKRITHSDITFISDDTTERYITKINANVMEQRHFMFYIIPATGSPSLLTSASFQRRTSDGRLPVLLGSSSIKVFLMRRSFPARHVLNRYVYVLLASSAFFRH